VRVVKFLQGHQERLNPVCSDMVELSTIMVRAEHTGWLRIFKPSARLMSTECIMSWVGAWCQTRLKVGAQCCHVVAQYFPLMFSYQRNGLWLAMENYHFASAWEEILWDQDFCNKLHWGSITIISAVLSRCWSSKITHSKSGKYLDKIQRVGFDHDIDMWASINVKGKTHKVCVQRVDVTYGSETLPVKMEDMQRFERIWTYDWQMDVWCESQEPNM